MRNPIVRMLLILLIGAALFCLLNPYFVPDLLDSRTMTCEEKLYEAMMEERENVHLIGYRLDHDSLRYAWSDTIYRNADLFFVADVYKYRSLGPIVLEAMPQYAVSGAELFEARLAYEQAMQEILDTVDPDWSDLETALYLHDYLCSNYVYDESLTRYTAYELLTEGTGVCQAYTLVYSALLNACGIDSSYVISSEMNHSWNVVTIDGSEYNVDVTFDDATPDRLGRVSHSHFLCSDEQLSEDHSFTMEEGFGRRVAVQYDHAAEWSGATTAFVPLGDDFYYMKKGMLYRWDGRESTYVDTIYGTWYAPSGGYWEGSFSVLRSDGQRLLISKPDNITAYDPVTDEYDIVYRYRGQGDIYGFAIRDGRLLLQVSDSPNDGGTIVDAGAWKH